MKVTSLSLNCRWVGKMKESITRSLQFLHRIAWIYKFSLSGIMLVGGSWLHFDDSVGTDSGAKAAALAFCTACILFIDLLPNSDGPKWSSSYFRHPRHWSTAGLRSRLALDF